MNKKNLKINIKSDGTVAGTSLMVNGVDLTKEKEVTSISFSADSMYEDYVYFNWSTKEKDEEGIVKTIRYVYSPRSSQITKGIGKKIGDSTSLQFENDSDRRVYDSIGTAPKSEQRIDILDNDKNDNKTGKNKIKLDKKWVIHLLTLSESGMGYQIVDITMEDGSVIKGVNVFNGEYLELPDEYKNIDVKKIKSIKLHKK